MRSRPHAAPAHAPTPPRIAMLSDADVRPDHCRNVLRSPTSSPTAEKRLGCFLVVVVFGGPDHSQPAPRTSPTFSYPGLGESPVDARADHMISFPLFPRGRPSRTECQTSPEQ